MRKSICIGNNIYKTKKEALLFYKNILNSYNFNEVLSQNDLNFILDLLEYDNSFSFKDDFSEVQESNDEELFVSLVRIGKAQFNTKCFEIIWNDGFEEFISYTQIINRHQTNNKLYFVKACRNCIQDDLRRVKQKYFDTYSIKGKVKCQESRDLLKWEDLVVDHRQPNTFSVIVDRFLEVKNILVDEVQFKEVNNILYFKDEILNKEFKEYHKEKAILRIVKKELNSSRTQFAKLKTFKNDLKIE